MWNSLHMALHTNRWGVVLASSELNKSRITVGPDEDGSRLDRVLMRRLGEAKRPLILRLIRKGNVRVNGKRSKPETRLHTDDTLFLPASLRGVDLVCEPHPQIAKLRTSIPVLYEDEDILVVNKPAGIVVHGGSGHDAGLIEMLKAERNFPDLRLAHRLDRDTSGVLLMAKHLVALRNLAEDFRERDMHKTYFAWVSGHPYPYAGRMRSRLAKGMLRGGERMVVDDESGKEAVTDYQVVMCCEQEKWSYALLALTPESGRTHQLRVQLQTEGHPILGDAKYAGRDDLKNFKRIGGKGLALHAWRLRFVHPVSNLPMELHAPWPDWWSGCFSRGDIEMIDDGGVE